MTAVAPQTTRNVLTPAAVNINGGGATGVLNTGGVVDTGALWQAVFYVKCTTNSVNASSAASVGLYPVSSLGTNSVPVDVQAIGTSPNPYYVTLVGEPGMEYNVIATNNDPVAANTITAQLVVDETTGVG